MRLSALTFAIVLFGITTAASAGSTGAPAPANVSAPAPAGCEPPDDAGEAACAPFHALIRANFTAREIGMLFGARTAYPEYRTGGIDRLQRRYQRLVQAYAAAAPRPGDAPLAAK